jgi:hypothetical protein
MRAIPHDPLGAIRFVSRYARYLGNISSGARTAAVGAGAAGRAHSAAEGICADHSRRHGSACAGRGDDRRVGQHARAVDEGPRAYGPGVTCVGFFRAEERNGGARRAGPRGVRGVQANSRGLSRAGGTQAVVAPGCGSVACQRSARLAHGIPAVRPDRHRQDFPGRVPGGRGGRAGVEAEELSRQMGRLERRQPGEDLPADPRDVRRR